MITGDCGRQGTHLTCDYRSLYFMIDPESADRIGPFWFIFPSVNWTRHRGIPIGARSLCSRRNYGERYGRIVITPTLFYNRNLRECVRVVYRVIVRCVALSGLWVGGGGRGRRQWVTVSPWLNDYRPSPSQPTPLHSILYPRVSISTVSSARR